MKNKIKMFFVKNTKPFIFGLMVGAIAVAMTLDNRAGAILKAFNAPEAVNAAQFQQNVVIKK